MSRVISFYQTPSIIFQHGEGVYLFDDTGRSYLDFAAGIAVNCLGHAHPRLSKVLENAAHNFWHLSNLYQAPWQEDVAELLAQCTFPGKAFFCNSGLEAVEAMVKFVRYAAYAKGQKNRTRLITFSGCFHGRSTMEVFLSGRPSFCNGVGVVVDGVDVVPFGSGIDEIARYVTDQTLGILLEPIQGEGGVRDFSYEFLRDLSQFARDHGLYLMLDEVQSGVGRTGHMWGYQFCSEFSPHILASGKGLAGGFPVGAVWACEEIASLLPKGYHGTTFGGNRLAMLLAREVLSIVSDAPFLTHVQEVSRYLRDRLEAIVSQNGGLFQGVSGRGLMMGVRLQGSVSAEHIRDRMLEKGVIVLCAGSDVLRLVPPLIIEKHHVDELISVFNDSIVDL